MKKKVVLLGKGTLSIRIADWFLKSDRYDLVQIVPVIPEPKWTDSLKTWAEEHNVPVVSSGHFKDLPGIDQEGNVTDLAMSVFYDKIIKDWFIAKCGKIINLHNGPLPLYRGVSPINWALKNGEIKHGITIHEITPGIDDGPILSQVEYSIYPEFDEVIDVYSRSLAYGWTLFEQTLPLIDRITPREQDHSKATYYNGKQNVDLGDRRGFTKAQSLK